MWAIGMMAFAWLVSCELVALEHALNGAQAGHGFSVVPPLLLLDAACAHRGKMQTRLPVAHQELTQTYKTLLMAHGKLFGMMVGCTFQSTQEPTTNRTVVC